MAVTGTTSEALTDTVREMIEERFGEDAEVSITHSNNHLDVRVLPTDTKTAIEADHDITVVPYQAFRMTIRADD